MLQYFNNIIDRFQNILAILQYFQEIFLHYCLNISVLCGFLFTHFEFCDFSVDKRKATIKTISHIKSGRSFKKYSKFTPTIHITEFLSIQDNFYTDYRTVFYDLLHQWLKLWKSGYKLRKVEKPMSLPYLLF